MIEVKGLPKGSRFKGYRTYQVQELVIYSERIEYRLERWRLPNGDYVVAELPFDIQERSFWTDFASLYITSTSSSGSHTTLIIESITRMGRSRFPVAN